MIMSERVHVKGVWKNDIRVDTDDGKGLFRVLLSTRPSTRWSKLFGQLNVSEYAMEVYAPDQEVDPQLHVRCVPGQLQEAYDVAKLLIEGTNERIAEEDDAEARRLKARDEARRRVEVALLNELQQLKE
jgi:hypothetical protein